MESEIRTYRTGSDEVVLDLTRDCRGLRGRPRATACCTSSCRTPPPGIAIIETGAGCDDDLLAALGDLLPADDRWRHRHGVPGHGRSHVMPAIVPPHATVPVLDGRLALGTWQSICLVDLNVDNDRARGALVLPGGLSVTDPCIRLAGRGRATRSTRSSREAFGDQASRRSATWSPRLRVRPERPRASSWSPSRTARSSATSRCRGPGSTRAQAWSTCWCSARCR